MMQQTVLLTAIRGPDGQPKYSPIKYLLRWYRRCILLSAMDGRVLTDPYENNGGSFTGPSYSYTDPGFPNWEFHMDKIVYKYLQEIDSVPHHFHMHFVHAVEILGYKHPNQRTRNWWAKLYVRLVNDFHLHPETEQEMDDRLGDSRSGWLKRCDPATTS